MISRFGRPGLIGLAARTAVVAGTATAVSGGMMAHRQKKAQTEYEAEQYEAAQQQLAAQQQFAQQQQQAVQQQAVQQQAVQAAPSPAPAEFAQAAAAPVDLVAELQKLGELRTQGILTDAEFDAAKAKLLA